MGGRLYLTGIVCQDWIIPPQLAGKLARDPDPFDQEDEGSKTLRLSDIFPDEAPLVPATWVTGLLTVATGGRLVYVRAGFGSLYASYRIVNVVQGRVRQVRDLSARDWARRCERYLPDDWFDEEPEDDAAEDEVAPDWRDQTGSSLRRLYYRAAQIEDLRHPCGTAPDVRPWPLWRDQRRVARRWLLRGERSRSSAGGRR